MRHGLFGKLEPGQLIEFESWQEVAKEVKELSYKKVNIFRSIISFAPKTAEEVIIEQKEINDRRFRRFLARGRRQ